LVTRIGTALHHRHAHQDGAADVTVHVLVPVNVNVPVNVLVNMNVLVNGHGHVHDPA
jgi:hypothetical protein